MLWPIYRNSGCSEAPPASCQIIETWIGPLTLCRSEVWAELNWQGILVARCTVERLMRKAGLRGLPRDKSPRTTWPAPETGRPTDLVERDFAATRVNQLRVADITCVRTAAGRIRTCAPRHIRVRDNRKVERAADRPDTAACGRTRHRAVCGQRGPFTVPPTAGHAVDRQLNALGWRELLAGGGGRGPDHDVLS
ncbi:IS3 family transposase [Kutzneria buriramensis]|uniref:IS3 family transposase n=1 Tax=Kutzneria buriramensis TaxID=1045776 RepID=UPI000E2645AE